MGVRFDRIPLRTHIISPDDDIVAVISRYTDGIAEPGDVVAIAETALAITQRRAVPPSRVRVGRLARVLSRFPDKGGSLATPAAMQLAINEVGMPRFLMGVAAAGIGKLLGRRGDFYRVAGRQLAQIDDIGGTIPPYEGCIILGPLDPHGVVEKIKVRLGIDALVADVNDLRRADILAFTGPYSHADLEEALIDNPFGNDDEQTPLVLLKPC